MAEVLWKGEAPSGGGVTLVRWTAAGEPRSALLWYGSEGWRAWRNRCPHWGVEMGAEGSRILDETGALRCGLHGARFSPDDGRCLEGPCVGASLEALQIEEERDGTLVLRDAPRIRLGAGRPRVARGRDE